MDFRGARMSGPPPHTSFRQRGRGNNHHQPLTNHHHPPQVPPRQMYNQPMPHPHPQWNPQSPHGSQAEGLNYAQPTFIPDHGFNNYVHHQPLPSPELMSPSPQPQGYSAYPQPMFIQQPVIYEHTTCYQQPSPMVHHATSPVVPMPEPVTLRNHGATLFQYNSKDNVTHCAKCNHKNVLAETEIIKRDEKIDSLERELQVFRKQVEDLMAENTALRVKSGDRHVLPVQDVKDESKCVSVGVSESTIETSIKENIGEAKKNSPLSPDALEFSPKENVTPATTSEVPVVSAKGMADDDGGSSSAVLGQEVATQVEENLFEDTAPAEIADVTESIDSNETIKDSSDQVKNMSLEMNKDSSDQVKKTNWSDEVETQENSFQEPKMEQVQPELPAAENVRDESAKPVPPMEQSEEWDESTMPTPPTEQSAMPTPPTEQNWRAQEQGGSNNNAQDHWQKSGRRYNQNKGGCGGRFRGGGGRGRRGQKQSNFSCIPTTPPIPKLMDNRRCIVIIPK